MDLLCVRGQAVKILTILAALTALVRGVKSEAEQKKETGNFT